MSPDTPIELAEHLQIAKGLPGITRKEWLPGVITEQDIQLPEDLKLLEDLAIAVAVGGDNREVAVIMEKATGGVHHFTLAIQGRLSRDDEEAARRLFQVLRIPGADFPSQIRSVISSYATPGMERALRVVAEPLDEFEIKVQDWLETTFKWQDLKQELPSSEEVLARFPKPDGMSVKKYITSLWMTLCESILDGNGNARQLSQINTDEVFLLAAQLSGSRFLKRLLESNSEKQFIGSVRYKLAMLGRYWTCVGGLAHRFRLIDGRFDYSWVRETQPLEKALRMTRVPQDIITCINPDIKMYCGYAVQDLVEQAAEQYKEDIVVSVHPEIQLILNGKDNSAPYVGSSTGACFCCKLWIDDYNKRRGAKWEITRSLEQPDETWAAPSPSGEDVMKMIHHEVTEMMYRTLMDAAGGYYDDD
ncbi:hypothetical protein OE88DRAFT_1669278 [Heliocybe sulcata]|uniref:Uncharacterized protein n=1 Tax=Heliocybe sulcata TaxID=5364 RepID=A0A5C3MJ35_9AGAM|nr:hypothetical protein OE88DRAFT_1669278 [Heliocybe sulcata]